MKQFIAQHKVRIAFIGILLVVFTVAGLNLFYGELRKRSKAAPTGTAVLFLYSVNDVPMDNNRGMKIGIFLDPNGATQNLYSFDIQVKFNPDKFEFNNGTLEDSMMLSPDILKQQAVLEGADTIHIVGTKTTNPFAFDNQQIGSIFFKMKEGKDFPAEFTWGDAVLETSNFVKVPLILKDNSNVSSSSSSSQNPDEVKLSFSSDQIQYHIGETVRLDLMLVAGSKQIGSVGAGFVFDPVLLEYKSATVDTATFDQTAIVIPPPAGQSFISVNAARKSATSGSMKIATVTFTAKAVGTANFAYTKDKSVVYTFGASPLNILTIVNPYSVSISTLSSSSSSSSTSSVNPPGVSEESSGTLLHINSNASYPSPFRYEQIVDLQSTDYTLSGLAKVYTSRGRGVQIMVFCGEANCNNGKKQNDLIAKTPFFQPSSDFRRQETSFKIENGTKKYLIRIFADEGSEVDFDYISLKNVWDGELIENPHFEKKTSKSFPRKYPEGWDFDANGLMYGGLYKQTDGVGNEGVLFINSPSR